MGHVIKDFIAINDAYVCIDNPDTNYIADHDPPYYSDNNGIRVAGGDGMGHGTADGWMNFDLTSIPAGSSITSATLFILAYGGGNANYGNPTAHMYTCRSPNTTGELWTEDSITWNNAPTEMIQNYIGDFVGPDFNSTEQISGDPIEYSFGMTDWISRFVGSLYPISFYMNCDASVYFCRLSSHRYGNGYSYLHVEYDEPVVASTGETLPMMGVG